MGLNFNITGDLPQPFSEEELIKHFEAFKNGDELARKEIIEHNMRLVIYQIEHYFFNTSFDADDLFQIGVIGLIKAVDSFDINKKIKFNTYASRCIINTIRMHFRNSKKIKYDISLNSLISYNKEGEEIPRESILVDTKTDIVEDYIKKEEYKLLNQLVSQLPDFKRKIIELYFGFYDEPINQVQIANIFNISRSYVSKIIQDILKKFAELLEQEKLIDESISYNLKK